MSKGEKKIKPSQYFEQAKGYYDNYSRWKADATSSHERKSSSFRANNAAAGVQEGDTKLVEDKYKAEYDKRIKGINSGVHGQFLNDYFNQTKQTLIKQITIDNEAQAKKDAEAKAIAENPFYSRSSAPTAFIGRARSKYGGENYFKDLGGIEDIQNLTMEDFYSSKFGNKKQNKSKEKEAILKASNFGRGDASRRGAAAAAKQPESNKLGSQTWWG